MQTDTPQIQLQGQTCEALVTSYSNGTPKITLIDASGAPIAVATSNFEEEASSLNPSETFVEVDEQTLPILEALIESGVVSDTGETVMAGWSRARIVRLTP